MRFQFKVLFGFLFMSLVFSGGVLICLKTLGPIERSFERHTSENLPVLNAIQSIRSLGSVFHGEMLELSYILALEVTPESQHALKLELVEIGQTRKQLLTEMGEYRKLVELFFPEESNYLLLLQAQIDPMILMVDELQKRTPGQSGNFSIAMKTRFESLEQSFLAVTNEIISYEVREVHMRREAVNEAVEKARFWIGASFGISLGLTLLLTLLLTRLSSAHELSGDEPERRREARRSSLRDSPP